jgi:hypothetical protein
MSHRVYKVADLGAPRDHHAIFVDTNVDSQGGGLKLHVTGNMQSGMTFEVRRAERPENSPGFVDKTLLGWVSADKVHHIERICRGIEAPRKQFDGPKRLYPKEPLRRCQEWTSEAIDALMADGVLQTKETGA